MNGDDDQPPEGTEEQRTVFVPSSLPPTEPMAQPLSEETGTEPEAAPSEPPPPASTDASPSLAPAEEPTTTPPAPAAPEPDAVAPPPPADPEPAPPPAEASPATVYNPGPLPSPPPPPPQPPVSTTAPPTGQTGFERGSGGIYTAFTPRSEGMGIQVGDVLNHIFEVKRFIARGGMGEVFEGINVNTDERVAIKVMLPALAADPNVISMFRKEARTLTRLQAESLVQYRVLAQEPQLGILYIVTEYIDGSNLADVLGSLNPSPADLLSLLRRLARGLRAAHQLGAIHRDISPDNVLLEDGKLEKAKIIDFGIAKDLDPGSATIVGDGFAGKLNYVAPEQLGDFGRDVGPWTDVYSLALVIMAVAMGRNVQMGGSLVDAVDKRRAGVDLSAMPEEIRPVLEKMLRPNPAERFRSMDDVLAELDQVAAPPVYYEEDGQNGGGSKMPLFLVGGGVLLVALIAVGWFMFGRGPAKPVPGAPGTGPVVAVNNSDPVEAARAVVDATLPSVSCTWLTIVDISKSANGPLIKLTGVAGNPAAAQSEISRALAQRQIQGANIDFEEVSPITQSGCAALDTYRQIRAPNSTRLSVPQRKFEMRMQPNDQSLSGYPGQNAANVVLAVNIEDPKLDFAMIGLEPSGVIDAEFFGPGTGVFGHPEIKKLSQTNARIATDLGGDKYKMQLDVNHTGWSGVLLLYGKGPFEENVIAPPLGARGPDWTNKFVSEAAAKGWQADMVWFKTVDEVKE